MDSLIKNIIKIILFVTFLAMQSNANAFDQESSTFSLIVYDGWKKNSKPLPEGWDYFIKIPSSLQTGGYYAESFITCDNLNTKQGCKVAIAHRGTTASIWDYYEDFLIFLELVPSTYKNALNYVNYVKNEAKVKNFDVYVYINTGHSLGGLLAELIQAEDRDPMVSYVYDSPGSKKIILKMIDEMLIPADSLEHAKEYIHYDFSSANAINTQSRQV
jgi:hypothetical protein